MEYVTLVKRGIVGFRDCAALRWGVGCVKIFYSGRTVPHWTMCRTADEWLKAEGGGCMARKVPAEVVHVLMGHGGPLHEGERLYDEVRAMLEGAAGPARAADDARTPEERMSDRRDDVLRAVFG